MGKKAKKKWTEAELTARIKARSELAHGYFLTQFTIEGRRADAVWLDGYKMTLTGFEVKCSRADFLTELKDPWKSHAVGQFCNQWYIVVPTRDFVKPKELPSEWGLMVAHGHSTKIIKPAPFNKEPEPWSKELFVRLIRKIQPMYEQSDEERLRQEGRAEGHERGYAAAKARYSDSSVAEQLDALRAQHERFQQVTGVTIGNWNMADIAGELALLQELGRDGIRRQADRLAKNMEYKAGAIRAILDDSPGQVEINDGGSAGSIREIARQLLRFDGPLRQAATTIDGLTAILDSPLPEVEEQYMRRAGRLVQPVARLLGHPITVSLIRRVAEALQEEDHAEHEEGRRGVARALLPGSGDVAG